MPAYKYIAINQANEQVEGLVESNNEKEATNLIVSKGLRVVSMELGKAKKNKFANLNISTGSKIKTKDLVVFFRQFSVMVEANVAVVPSLKIIIEQTSNTKLKMLISEIADEVDGGSRLSEAMIKRPNVFSSFHVNVVKGGETSGKLGESLTYLADEMEKDNDMMSKMRGAMIYPAFVFSGMTIVGIIMMIFVVPKLTAILSEVGANLPFATRALIGASDVMQKYWWLLLIIVIGIIVGVKAVLKTFEGQYYRDLIILKLPIFGTLFKKIYVIRFSRSMSTLILGGVTINDSLAISSEVIDNKVYSKELEKAKKDVEDGGLLSEALASSKIFPQMVSQMVSIGEKTGRADIVFARIAEFYGREVNGTIANLMVLIEPIIMIIMGIAVGIMVAAIILPMYNMASQV